MLRLSPPGNLRLNQTNIFDINFGGTEANVAVSLAGLGIHSAYMTRLPDNMIGRSALEFLRKWGVDTSMISLGGSRMGLYYLENGASFRGSQVIYDRAGSAVSEAELEDFDFEEALRGASWLHVSGITPALSDSCCEIVRELLILARKLNITTSFDLNYRKKLWDSDKATQVTLDLVKNVDIIMGNEEDAFNMLGIKSSFSHDIVEERYKRVSEEIFTKISGLKYFITTLRESISADVNRWSGMIYDGSQFYRSKVYDINVIDRVGAGDAFCAGFIYEFLRTTDIKKSIDFAAAASAFKHTIIGDVNVFSENEIRSLLDGNIYGRINR